VAAEVTQEIVVLFQHHDSDSGASEQQSVDHAGGPATGDAHLGLHNLGPDSTLLWRLEYKSRLHQEMYHSSRDGAMTRTVSTPQVVEAALRAAEKLGKDVADVPVAMIAAEAGISRSTLLRRFDGSRAALNDAVRAAGVDPGGLPPVRDRAIAAAAALI